MTSTEFAKAVSGLTPNTTYHYRVVATNADGTSNGVDRTFTVGWSVQTPAANSPTSVFEGVSCSAANACTAVGWTGTQAIAQRWNGTEWKAQTPVKPEGASEYLFLGVSCPSSTACTAVGRYKNASAKWVSLVEFWNGSEWKIQSSPNPTSAGVQLDNVSCLSSTECTAVGYYWTSSPETNQTLALRWNGTEWKIQATTNPSAHAVLRSVSCTSSTFCMAAGFYNNGSGSYLPLSEVWNGTEWTTKTAVEPPGSPLSWFYGVSCTSSTACTAVGIKEVSATTHEYQTMAQRWNGSSWTLQATPNPVANNRYIEDVSCTTSTSCTALGYLSEEATNPFLLRWNGSEWTAQILTKPAGATKVTPHGISCIASRGCELVGQYSKGTNEVVLLAEGSWRAAMPTVTTGAATALGEKTATLNGTVNPNGSETKAYFEYGTSTSYGSKSAEVNLGSGTASVEASAALSGLSPATTYHYRLVANNENPETSRGGDQTFRTTGPPTVSTSFAEVDPSGEAATLRGWVNPNGLATTYQFEYGTSSGVYTTTVPVPAEAAGSGTEEKFVTYKVTGLSRNTKYFYRITASNSAGKSVGSESSFTTPGLPGASTFLAGEVTRKCATLKGVVEPHGLSTQYWFEYGTTTSYGSKVPLTAKEVGGGTTSKAVEEVACGLSSNTLYHYRLVAKNSLGTTNGSDVTFTTLAAVTLSVKGTPLKAGAPIKAAGTNLKFTSNTGWVHTCQEVELGGAVTENPGALQTLSTLVMQNSGGAACSYEPGSSLTIKYSSPTAGKTLEYTYGKPEEGLIKASKFVLIGTIYLGLLKYSECEYNAELTGAYPFAKPLVWTLAGKLELIKATPSGAPCFASETLSGSLSVTSNLLAVEATH